MQDSDQSHIDNVEWWVRPDLKRLNQELIFQEKKVSELVGLNHTPLYVYGVDRVLQNIMRLMNALDKSHPTTQLYFAMKSNRYGPLLKSIAKQGSVGIDACSPGEVELALSSGFKDFQISYTATGMSFEEWQEVLKHPNIRVNADSFGDIDKISRISPNRKIGIRVNSGVSLGYRKNSKLMYTQDSQFSKFGISLEQFSEAVEYAKSLGLRVVGIHSHCGCGFLSEQMKEYESMLLILKRLLEKNPEIATVNLGGGLGIPLVQSDEIWDLDRWGSLIKNTFSGWPGEICLEPGDYIVKDAGILLVEVTNVERKFGKKVVWVNAGFNVHPEPVFYDLPLFPVPVLERRGKHESVVLAGNINEAHDIWYHDVCASPLEEGDLIAFLNAGGYGSSMSSNHCCRGEIRELMI